LEQMSAEDGVAPGETTDLGHSDRTMATRGAVFPLWGMFWMQSLARGSSEAERRVTSRIDDGGSWRRGTAKAERRLFIVLRVQGGGIYLAPWWRRWQSW
jgi:hypothetical protein